MGINPPPTNPPPNPPTSPPPPIRRGYSEEIKVKEITKEPDLIGFAIVLKLFGL